MCVFVFVCMCTCVYVCVCMYVRTYVYVCMSACVCVCAWKWLRVCSVCAHYMYIHTIYYVFEVLCFLFMYNSYSTYLSQCKHITTNTIW